MVLKVIWMIIENVKNILLWSRFSVNEDDVFDSLTRIWAERLFTIFVYEEDVDFPSIWDESPEQNIQLSH